MKRTYSTNTLNSYFSVVPKKVMKGVGDDGSSRSSSSSSSQHKIVVPESLTTVSTLQTSVNNDNTPEQVSAEESNEVDNYDIGRAVDCLNGLLDFQKYNYLKYTWIPEKNYSFPFSEHNKNNKLVKRYLRYDHLQKYSWIAFSDLKKGLFCKHCAIFANSGGKNKATSLQGLVTTPVTKFTKLFGMDGVLDKHNTNRYHIEAVLSSDNFIRCYENRSSDIRNLIDSARSRQIEDNRNRLKPIIRSIIFLAKQCIPFRGHRDDGPLLEESNVTNNKGNFRELLRFRIEAGDKTLEEHFRNTSSRATYISKRTQNELIECCKNEILSAIVKKIGDAKYYSIMFNETTDIAHVSQMSIVIRYLEGINVQEDFVSFIDCHSESYELSPDTLEPVLNGTILGKTVIKPVQKSGLPLENCVGICTDDCSVMTSKQQGAVQEVQKKMKIAVRCPCFNHALNLSLSKSSNVQSVRNAVGVMKEIIYFFKASSKRNYVLKQTLGDQLSGLCETRWVERHDAVLQFKASIEKMLQALNLISEWNKRQSSSKARSHILAISSNCSFIITLFCLNEVLAITLPLSKLSQKKKWI
ncbi:hypothetical protein JTB14_034179 [Gonioctena quinquepunctata]|nr:hypothetical protein JTB14_034179 [Gonioctena quinquepunctata]